MDDKDINKPCLSCGNSTFVHNDEVYDIVACANCGTLYGIGGKIINPVTGMQKRESTLKDKALTILFSVISIYFVIAIIGRLATICSSS